LQKELSIDDSRAMNETMSQQLASVPLFFSYSPEELLQQPKNKRKAWADLQLLQKIIEKK
jgi:uracil-DNA glycosylase